MSAANRKQKDEPIIPFRANRVQTLEKDEVTRIANADSSYELNHTGRLVWSLCNGNFNTDEIARFVAEAYPEAADEAVQHTHSLIGKLTDRMLLQLKSESEFNAAAPWNSESSFVHYHRPTAEMLWHLEQARQFVFGLYEPFDFKPVDTETAELGEDGLIVAKLQDADTARSIGQSELKKYQNFTHSATFTSHIEKIQHEIARLIEGIEPVIKPSGHAYYQKGGYMGWHSNHKMAGRRVYCTWTEKEKSNFFRYEDPVSGDLVTHWEPPGWTIKSFQIPPSPYRLWHCIQAGSRRFALGFRATEEETEG